MGLSPANVGPPAAVWVASPHRGCPQPLLPLLLSAGLCLICLTFLLLAQGPPSCLRHVGLFLFEPQCRSSPPTLYTRKTRWTNRASGLEPPRRLSYLDEDCFWLLSATEGLFFLRSGTLQAQSRHPRGCPLLGPVRLIVEAPPPPSWQFVLDKAITVVLLNMGRLHSATPTTPSSNAGLPSVIPDTPLLELTPPLSMWDKVDIVLGAIEHSWVSMETRLGTLVTELSFLHDNHCKLSGKVSEGEIALTTLHPLATDNQYAIRNLQERVCQLEDKVEDIEDRLQRSNK
ncbi:hypothetical protein NDU88_006589 [Pleurodeles waltl]|uniref:Uncharacterized protein n=1 Tax=Pleurodeles waltl TaxID=8319 RepID=A0AAV7NVJ2_PLEWA|nr:hypothetical protein NDU88_006589 [Pleurodeles waltl]